MRSLRWVAVFFLFVISAAVAGSPSVRAEGGGKEKQFTACLSTCSTGYNECLMRQEESKRGEGKSKPSTFIEK